MKKTIILVLFMMLMILPLTAVSISSAQTYPTVAYTVQEGDSLSKIARKFCTTWQEVYQLNAGIIGSDPNVVEPGTVLYVIDRCGTNPGDGVYDRGPRLHANGTVSGNVYTVAAGDTLFSIGERFGLPWQVIAEANHTSKIYPGQRLIIPGLNQPPNPSPQPAIQITSPAPGTYLSSNFIVSGTGQGLPEGNVVVRVFDGNGNLLAEQATVLQGNDAGIGGPGVWSTTFNGVIGQPNSNGSISAFNPETGANNTISIWFTGN